MYGQHIATRWLIKLKTNKKHHLEKSKLKTNKKREEENCGRLGAWLTDRDEMEIVKLEQLLIISNLFGAFRKYQQSLKSATLFGKSEQLLTIRNSSVFRL